VTEAEWLACTDPKAMLEFLGAKAGDRKIRLFALACCRRTWYLLYDPRLRNAIDVNERYADGEASRAELDEAALTATDVPLRMDHHGFLYSTEAVVWSTAIWLHFTGLNDSNPHRDPSINAACAIAPPGTEEHNAERAHQSGVIRDLFGNPFRPIVFALDWQMPNVTAVARSVYDQKDFASLPVLAAALEEAGCQDAEILSHCRSPGSHVRGCWVVDLILGKT
jgi:hypothetical protein